MNFYTFKITEPVNGFYAYVASLFDDTHLTLETFEHYIANSPHVTMCQYLYASDFDNMCVEKSNINPIDVINKHLPQDDKCVNVSQTFMQHIPPKPKRETKPKPAKEPKAPKQRGKSIKKVEISTEQTTVNVN